MDLFKRRILYLGFFLIFFIFAPIIIAYSSGYRINIKKKKIYETGSLVVDTKPREANVALDSKMLSETTPLILNDLKQGFYELLVTKPGYTTWRKKIYINSKLTTFVKGIRLFPQGMSALEFTPSKTILARKDIFEPIVLSSNSKEAVSIKGLELWILKLTAQKEEEGIFLTRFSSQIKKVEFLDDNNILVLVGNELFNVERDGRDVRNITSLYKGTQEIEDFGIDDKTVYFKIKDKSFLKIFYLDVEK